MAYSIKGVTLRTDNSKAGMAKIDELWRDIESGKLPLLFNSDHELLNGISPVSRYSNYASGENGEYDLSILAVTAGFFGELENGVREGRYRKYDESDENGDISQCARKAWEKVWAEKQSGAICRAFTEDYESTVPAQYTKDGKAHCYLYIAVK